MNSKSKVRHMETNQGHKSLRRSPSYWRKGDRRMASAKRKIVVQWTLFTVVMSAVLLLITIIENL